jgi:hypothetical protein
MAIKDSLVTSGHPAAFLAQSCCGAALDAVKAFDERDRRKAEGELMHPAVPVFGERGFRSAHGIR